MNLSIHRASYHVEAANGPGLPVYERTGELVAGNESTQLLVSPHAQAPFGERCLRVRERCLRVTQRRAGFLASYKGVGFNHRIGLPHTYGRYEVRSTHCQFMHTKSSGDTGRGLRLHLSATPGPWLEQRQRAPSGQGAAEALTSRCPPALQGAVVGRTPSHSAPPAPQRV